MYINQHQARFFGASMTGRGYSGPKKSAGGNKDAVPSKRIPHGDPDVLEPSQAHLARGSGEKMPDKVDVLIVGCGPAGLTWRPRWLRFPT